ncbi:DUF1217 domain-containing protein [Flexibacterium corallicola]|uniref:DUF1217 domain-containing protein n=1 Tax=Flexibacterium corallicola TaxID=3037259 RepID=UPI00286F89AF|nr:DUF1217 domain-containing protein [Pseudovibrio sp. M1P-2-3]
MDTTLRYSLLVHDLPAAREQTAKAPDIAPEIEYFEENFDNVKTVDDLLDDHRLYTFMMKSMGLEDMIYAKGLIREVLVQGTDSDEALANTMNDGRYYELASTFQFEEDGSLPGGFSDWKAKNENGDYAVNQKYLRKATPPGGEIDDLDRLTRYYEERMLPINNREEILFTTELLTDPALYTIIAVAYDVPQEIINGPSDDRVEWFQENLDVEEMKDPEAVQEAINKYRAPIEQRQIDLKESVIDQYIQVTFEEEEGEKDEGVRLALNFQRTAGDITDAYQILSSPALYEVVRTVLGIPDNLVGTDIDGQAALINRKYDIEKLQDPDEVEKFVEKFVNLYDAQQATTSPTVQLFAGGAASGISPDLLTSINSLKLGG